MLPGILFAHPVFNTFNESFQLEWNQLTRVLNLVYMVWLGEDTKDDPVKRLNNAKELINKQNTLGTFRFRMKFSRFRS